MSKKSARKKFKGEFFKNGKLYTWGKYLNRYMELRTCKVKHKHSIFDYDEYDLIRQVTISIKPI